jgi:hypothetical protein
MLAEIFVLQLEARPETRSLSRNVGVASAQASCYFYLGHGVALTRRKADDSYRG